MMFILNNAVVIFGVFISGCVGNCLYRVKHCQAESGLMEHLRSAGIGIKSEYSMDHHTTFRMDKRQLSQFCSLFDKYKSCMGETAMEGCSVRLQVSMSAATHVMQYICEDTFDEFIEKHQECLRNASLVTYLRRCKEGVNIRQKGAMKELDICREVTETLSCERRNVEFFCKAETAAWFRTLISKINQPISAHYGCFENDKEATSAHGSAGIQEQDGNKINGIQNMPSWVVLLLILSGILVLLCVLCGLRCCLHTFSATDTNRSSGSLTFDIPDQYKTSSPPHWEQGHEVVISDRQKLVPV